METRRHFVVLIPDTCQCLFLLAVHILCGTIHWLCKWFTCACVKDVYYTIAEKKVGTKCRSFSIISTGGVYGTGSRRTAMLKHTVRTGTGTVLKL